MVIDHMNCHTSITSIKGKLIEILCRVQEDSMFTGEHLQHKLFEVIYEAQQAESIHFGVVKEFFDEQTKSLNNTLAGR
ncbi:hypothetical protein [Paenibacillus sp. F4]|uniref:hypothetical protein n=1 Tax=Paenibacillus sp. F4 TaxID=357385 RepID=UPI000C9FB4B0|nr:hypothetical protein [Paenibacillus sp. F4]PNQ78899.1 hypothetical protein C1T21_22905 [Paenibacillus sp. F4]